VVLAIGDDLIEVRTSARLCTKPLVAAPDGRAGRPHGMQLESGQPSTPAIYFGIFGTLSTEDQRHVAENLLAFAAPAYACGNPLAATGELGRIFTTIPLWSELHAWAEGAEGRIQAADGQKPENRPGFASELPAVGGDTYACLDLNPTTGEATQMRDALGSSEDANDAAMLVPVRIKRQCVSAPAQLAVPFSQARGRPPEP